MWSNRHGGPDKYVWGGAVFALAGSLFFGIPIHASSFFLTTSGPDIDTLTNLSGGNLDKTLAIISIDSTLGAAPNPDAASAACISPSENVVPSNPSIFSNGFRLEIASLKNGKFVRFLNPGYADSLLSGNVSDYTFSIVSGTGTLGFTEPGLPISHALATPITLDFVSPVSDTVEKKYHFVFTALSKTALFLGTFRDELSLTLSDL